MSEEYRIVDSEASDFEGYPSQSPSLNNEATCQNSLSSVPDMSFSRFRGNRGVLNESLSSGLLDSSPAPSRLEHGENVKSFLGKRPNRNTEKNTACSVRCWAKVQLGAEYDGFVQSNNGNFLTAFWEKLKNTVLSNYCNDGKPTDICLHNINVSLGDLVTNYRQSNGGRVSPATMRGYLDGINRFLQDYGLPVDVQRDPVFIEKNTGYMTAFNNIARCQQADGVHRRPHNVILDAEIERMLCHSLTNPSTPSGYCRRLMLTIGLLTGLRGTSLRLLSWKNFTHSKDIDGNDAYRYVGSVGGSAGDCKNQKGGLNSVKDVPTHFMIFDEELAFEINPYRIILRHEEECSKVKYRCDAFFLSPIHNARENRPFLKSSPVECNAFSKWFNELVDACNVVGHGFRKKPTLHSLRATMISKLQRMGHTESQIVQRTGHKSISSLKSYTSTLGLEGQRQQKHIFTDTRKKSKPNPGSNSNNLTDVLPPQTRNNTAENPYGNIVATNVSITYNITKQE